MTGRAAGTGDDVLVLGGGVIGLSIAEALAQEGLRVRVVETDRVGAGASGAAAGMLAPISEVLLHGEAAPEPLLLDAGLESLSRFPALTGRLRDETGIDPEFEESGLWRPVASEAERVEAVERQSRIGVGARGIEWLDARALADAAPGFHSSIRGAFFSPLECHVRPPLLLRALAESVRRRGGEIEEGVTAQRLLLSGGRVVGVETSAGRRHADWVVVATGAWSSALLGAPVFRDGPCAPRIEPVRGQIVAFSAPLPPVREIVFTSQVYCVPKRDGTWIIGATEERVGFDRRVTAEGVALLIDRARALFPQIEEATFDRAWAGLRPVASTLRPWVGAAPEADGLVVATGHARNGVLLAPITAERVRDLVLGKGVGSQDLLAPSDG